MVSCRVLCSFNPILRKKLMMNQSRSDLLIRHAGSCRGTAGLPSAQTGSKVWDRHMLLVLIPLLPTCTPPPSQRNTTQRCTYIQVWFLRLQVFHREVQRPGEVLLRRDHDRLAHDGAFAGPGGDRLAQHHGPRHGDEYVPPLSSMKHQPITFFYWVGGKKNIKCFFHRLARNSSRYFSFQFSSNVTNGTLEENRWLQVPTQIWQTGNNQSDEKPGTNDDWFPEGACSLPLLCLSLCLALTPFKISG